MAIEPFFRLARAADHLLFSSAQTLPFDSAKPCADQKKLVRFEKITRGQSGK
jgi:hypothetical protein